MKVLVKTWIKIVFICLILGIFFLFVLFYFSKADIYSKLGSYYIKKDDYTAAQKYYEKSYLLGNKSKAFREKYVNLLINSPLTIEAQERLVSIAEDGINDSATESARYFLYNLKREIQNKYPDNYIQPALYNGKIVHWGKIPITYSIKQTKDVPEDVVQAVNDAFDSWERASSARIRFERVSINPDIAVNFINYTVKSPKPGEKYVIAYTLPDLSQNKLNRMDLILNITSVDGKQYTPNQIYNTALHEIFHALGFMGHSFNKDNIMYVSQNNEVFINDERRKISEADKSTLELFYKIRPDITNAEELVYDYIPYPVVGNNAEVSYAKVDEAKKYINKAPKIPAGYIDLAQALITQKDYEGADSNLQKALYLSNNDETKYMALYNLAVVHFLDKDYDFALFYADKAKEIKNNDELHILKAEIYKNADNKLSAINEYSYLVSKNPDNAEYVISLSNLYIEKHNYLKARKTLKNYLQRNPHEKNNPRFKKCRLLLL